MTSLLFLLDKMRSNAGVMGSRMRGKYFVYVLLAVLVVLVAIPAAVMIGGNPNPVVNIGAGPSTTIPLSTGKPLRINAEPAEAPAQVPAVEEPLCSATSVPTPFAYRTNSTLARFSLDAKTRSLTLHVDGPDGSVGYLCINLPKDVFGEEISATIDNLSANSIISDAGSSKILFMTYLH
jgi:hypothetical protein